MAGIFLLVPSDRAEMLVESMNQARGEYDERLTQVYTKIRPIVLALDWEGVEIPNDPNERLTWETRQKLACMWRTIERHETMTAEDRAVLHKSEFKQYFAAPLEQPPSTFGSQLVLSMGGTEPTWLSEAWSSALACFEGTPFETRMLKAHESNLFNIYSNFEPVHEFVVEKAILANLAGYHYVFGYEPPSLHAAFCGYLSGKIDGKQERVDRRFLIQSALRETAEESGLSVHDLDLALKAARKKRVSGPFRIEKRVFFVGLLH
jgi:hypothetical protein